MQIRCKNLCACLRPETLPTRSASFKIWRNWSRQKFRRESAKGEKTLRIFAVAWLGHVHVLHPLSHLSRGSLASRWHRRVQLWSLVHNGYSAAFAREELEFRCQPRMLRHPAVFCVALSICCRDVSEDAKLFVDDGSCHPTWRILCI